MAERFVIQLFKGVPLDNYYFVALEDKNMPSNFSLNYLMATSATNIGCFAQETAGNWGMRRYDLRRIGVQKSIAL